jgi:hypothetical protein
MKRSKAIEEVSHWLMWQTPMAFVDCWEAAPRLVDFLTNELGMEPPYSGTDVYSPNKWEDECHDCKGCPDCKGIVCDNPID